MSAIGIIFVIGYFIWIFLTVYNPGIPDLILTIITGQKKYLKDDMKNSNICNTRDDWRDYVVSDDRKDTGN